MCSDPPSSRHQLGSKCQDSTNINLGTGLRASRVLCSSMEQEQAHIPGRYQPERSHAHMDAGCLRPTPTEQLPVLAGIPPPDVRRKAATLAIALKSEETGHLLHKTMINARGTDGESRRLTSRNPFAQQAALLTKSLQPEQTVKDWTAKVWKAQWNKTTSPLQRFITDPTITIAGCNLPRSAWTKLNRLRSGVGRFNANLFRWGLVQSPACECGSEEQTADHVITDCTLHGPPNGISGLMEMDAATTEWLLSNELQL